VIAACVEFLRAKLESKASMHTCLLLAPTGKEVREKEAYTHIMPYLVWVTRVQLTVKGGSGPDLERYSQTQDVRGMGCNSDRLTLHRTTSSRRCQGANASFVLPMQVDSSCDGCQYGVDRVVPKIKKLILLANLQGADSDLWVFAINRVRLH
jgi:hypothetical protein